jgi:hypothetical protein
LQVCYTRRMDKEYLDIVEHLLVALAAGGLIGL